MSKHPELEQLKKYLGNTDSDEFADLRIHLAQCSQCRTLVDGLMAMTQISVENLADTLSDDEHQEIMDYVDAYPEKEDQLRQFIESSPAAMKAALHYASHKSSMDRANIQAVEVSSKKIKPRDLWTGLTTKLKQWFTIQTPAWITVPVMAALVAVLSLNVIKPDGTDVKNYSLASYQDNPVILFHSKQTQPGIGFFARSAKSSQAFDKLKVSVSNDRDFHISWAPIARAIKYTLRLQMFEQGTKVNIGEVTTEKTSVIISPALDNIFHRYEWVLSGETQDNRVFMASGGFVIDETR